MICLNLTYNNEDITASVNTLQASITDSSGGIADKINIVFSDTEKYWRQWKPQKGDVLTLSHGSFSSGTMYLDEFEASNGTFALAAISTPLKAKHTNSKTWENIRFIQLAKQLVTELGLELVTYHIQDYLYDRLDMLNKTNLQFLNERCILEGYSLKISNGKAILYDEKTLEASSAVSDIKEDMFLGDPSFKTVSSGIYSSSSIEYFSHDNKIIKYRFEPSSAPMGPELTLKIRANNQGEAERYARNILRSFNKNETIGAFTIEFNSNLAAGSVVNIKDMGSFSGKYYITSIKHNLTSEKSRIIVRKVLEGY